MQLDIFEDSRDTQLRNDLAGALLRHDAGAARAACTLLAEEFPGDAHVAPALRLLEALAQRTGPAFTGHEQALQARQALLDEVAPAAQRVLGGEAANGWLALDWSALARRAAGLPFDPRQAGTHAAALWLRARDWDRAAAAVGRIESWRRIPAPLAWMAEARYHQLDLDGSWDLLAELAWLSPRLLDELMRSIGDPLLQKLRERFDASFDGDGGVEDLAWFPAWLLTEKPSLGARLALAQRGACTPPEQAMRLLLELLGLERQGRQRDVVAQRKALQAAHPALYACYLATR